jgi:hypothetical protein
MAAITYGAGAPAATTATAPAAVPARSFWTRLWDAFIEARMKQAMREVALHRHLLPAELETKYGRGTAKTNP